jgi:hypothetical protein
LRVLQTSECAVTQSLSDHSPRFCLKLHFGKRKRLPKVCCCGHSIVRFQITFSTAEIQGRGRRIARDGSRQALNAFHLPVLPIGG